MTAELSPLLALVAGVLSILSPCVLPLVPIVFSGAQSRHPLGPLALGTGLAVSFTAIGLFVATIGFSIGLDGELFRTVGGILLTIIGVLLVSSVLQIRVASGLGPVGNWASSKTQRVAGGGLPSQFLMGALLGLVWLPCVGPTLGAASVLAASGDSLDQVALVMLAFGIGAAVPLAAVGTLTARRLAAGRSTLSKIGTRGKTILGGALAVAGILIVTGADKSLEAFLTEAAPEWLVELTTRY